MMKKLICVFLMFASVHAAAKEVEAHVRLIGGFNSIDPKDVNEEMELQGLKKFDSLLQYGLEAAFPMGPFSAGLRYIKRTGAQDENPAVLDTAYRAQIDQDSAQLVGRFAYIRTKLLRADVFGGFGGTNTNMKIRSATQDGQLSKKDNNAWFAGSMSSFGTSVGIGWEKFYFVIEAGVETNKVKDLKRSGTVNTNIEEIDLSGSFVTIGIFFDGMALKKK